MEETRFHPLDYVAVLKRRRWWFIAPVVLTILVGAALAMFLPRQYKSEAEVGVAESTLSAELLRGVQSFDAGERQRAVQQLLSRTVLERVVREEGLNPNQPVEETAMRLRARVQENISVPPPIGKVSSGQKEGLETFKLGYVDSTPERAQRIANRLATVFVEENSKAHTQRAENTSEVLAQQLRVSQDNLRRLQEELRKKKETYMGRLPDQITANTQILNGLRTQHDSLSLQLRAEQDRLTSIEGQLDLMRQGLGGVGMTSSGAAAIQTAQSRINQLRQQLEKYQALGYTDKHPDIIQTKEELSVAMSEVTSARKQSPVSTAEVLNADPAFRQKENERKETALRINTLKRQIDQALNQIASYQARVEAAPVVEQELASLTQDFKLEEARYNELSTKHQSAVMAEDLARKQGGERFVVLNPAFLPTTPISPDVIKLMLMATALGFVLGAAGVVGRELLDRSVHDTRALQSEFDVPVLGEIPHIHGVA